jgi:hypothetical protein
MGVLTEYSKKLLTKYISNSSGKPAFQKLLSSLRVVRVKELGGAEGSDGNEDKVGWDGKVGITGFLNQLSQSASDQNMKD